MYDIEIKLASKNGWFTPAEAKSYYGRYSRDGITIHWWNSPDKVKDSDHDNIVNYMNNQASAGNISVNYVLSNNKITLSVNPDNVAWASNNGNPTTISVECSPHLNAEGYKKAGWLIWQLEGRYNKKLALYRHSDWTTTSCPGTLDINRMRAEANKWANGDYDPKPPKKEPAKAKLAWTKISTPKVYQTNKPTTNLWDFNNTTWTMKSVKTFKKDEKIIIYGKCVNETLGATYLLTEYSYTQKITNGFNQADLDVYVEPKPVPTPTPPKEQQPDKEEPTKPEPTVPKDDSDFEKRLSALEKLVKYITDFLSSIFNNFKGA